MNRYFIENIGPVDQPVGPAKGPHSTLAPSQHVIIEAEADDVKWMEASSFLRVTKRKDKPEAAAPEAAADATAPLEPKPAEKPAGKSGVHSTEKV